jgi:hypothetical protein
MAVTSFIVQAPGVYTHIGLILSLIGGVNHMIIVVGGLFNEVILHILAGFINGDIEHCSKKPGQNLC